MGRGTQPSDGSAFAAIVVLLLVVGFIIKYIWWIVGAAAVAGVAYGGWVVVRKAEERRALEAELAEEREFELQRRAERQRRWMLTGDSRAIYGEDGAAAMRAMASPLPDDDEAAQENEPVARLATTAAELEALVKDKPQAWPHALFASILVQRSAPLAARLRDSELGFTPAATTRIATAWELGRRVVGLMDEMLTTAQQLDTFMGAPAFMGAFSAAPGSSEPDPEAIAHIAHRTMDYHERFLDLSERCRALSAASQYSDILADCARFLDIPLQSYREFIDEYVDIVDSFPRVLEHATGDIHLGSLALYINIDDKVQSRIYKRLDAINPR
jgi:hypothetical protein